MVCLCVVGKDVDSARVLGPDDDRPVTDLPGAAEYLWVLWSGDQPSREALIDIYKQFPTSD